MFTLFFRGAILYIAMIITMRGLGKRQLGEFQPYEFAMAILLAEVIAAPMASASVPLLHGLVPVAAMFTVHGVISIAGCRWDRVRAFISGRPTVVIARGVIDRQALDRLCLSPADLLEGLRAAGFLSPGEVETAVVEANGGISAFPAANARPPRCGEMGIAAPPEGLPLTLVVNGQAQPRNLRAAGRDEAWLRARLAAQGLDPGDVYLAWLDARGVITAQPMDAPPVAFPADGPGKAGS